MKNTLLGFYLKMFLAGGQLVSTGGQNVFNLTFLKGKLPPDDQTRMGKILLTAGWFAQFPAFNKTQPLSGHYQAFMCRHFCKNF